MSAVSRNTTDIHHEPLLQDLSLHKKRDTSPSSASMQTRGDPTSIASTKHHSPLLQTININTNNYIIQASRLAAEPLQKTGVIIHFQGNSESGKNNNDRSQRKIEEERTCTDQEKYGKSTVPPPYVPVQKSKSFLTSKRPPASTVPSPYLRETKKTISARK